MYAQLMVGVGGVALLVGCGALPASELRDLRRQLRETQAHQEQASKQLEELENRVFLLVDQVETQKLAMLKAAAEQPVGQRTAGRPGTESPPVPVMTSRAEEPPASDTIQVAFEGEARPALKLSGSRPPEMPAKPAADPFAEHSAEQLREPLRIYRAAYSDLQAGRHDAAERGFREFVRRYPRHDYADNAQYWLGECYYDRKRFSEAAVAFRAVVERYPRGNKVPDAMLKLGYCLLELGSSGGRSTLEQLATSYPHTEAARLAERRLGELAALHAVKPAKGAP